MEFETRHRPDPYDEQMNSWLEQDDVHVLD